MNTKASYHVQVFELSPSGPRSSTTSLPSLPPPDRGRDAWLFLCGCFIVEASVWGFPFSFGVFQEYYSTHEPFQSNGSGIAIIGTLSAGIIYFLAPFVMVAANRFPQYGRLCTLIGFAILPLSLVASSFAKTVWQLMLTQGVLYAIGGSMLYWPTLIYLGEWFIKRKGLALGITFAGIGAGGVAIPLVMDWALHRYGVKTALQIWAVSLVVLTAPPLYFVKSRIPPTFEGRTAWNKGIDLSFLEQPIFWFMEIGNVFQGIGLFIPIIFLPTFASSIGVSAMAGSLTLSLLNASSVPGQILLGALTDRYAVTNIILLSTLGSAFSIFLIWGFSASIAPLYVFSLAYGFFAGGFSSCWAAVVQEVRFKSPKADAGLLFGLLSAGRGIGCVVCGSLSNVLLRYGDAGWGIVGAYETRFGLLIVFAGVMALLAGMPGVGRAMGLY